MRSLTDVSILQCRREIFFRRGMDSVRWFSRSHQSKTSVSRFVHLSSAGTCHGSDTFQHTCNALHCLTNMLSLCICTRRVTCHLNTSVLSVNLQYALLTL